MQLETQAFIAQAILWPPSGRHVLAHHDASTIVVYQAYRPSTGYYAVRHQKFGGPDFSLGRMSWVKPNFLWMMYRSGWGTKPGQEVTLGVRLSTRFFDSLLQAAVPSSFDEQLFPTHEQWKAAVAASDVRLQWDPDHEPDGRKTERRAIQLGLRGDALAAFAGTEILEVIDMSEFVASQRVVLEAGGLDRLVTPRERVYLTDSLAARERIGIQALPE